MKNEQLNTVNTLNLQDYALMCECAEEVARFGILSDFMKKAVTDFYSFKSNREELALDDMKILEKKLHELQIFFEKIIAKIE
jgi:hypothetical protein